MGSGRSVRALLAASLTVLVLLSGCGGTTHTSGSADAHSALYEAINRQLQLRPGNENVRAVLVNVGGKNVVERYDDTSRSHHWDIGWNTVAVVATLVGMAIDDGSISGLDATLGELLPDHAK